MRLTRLHVEAPLAPGLRLALPEAAAAHLRVLRASVGDACVLFNGDGRDYAARIVAADRRGAEVEVQSVAPGLPESPLRLTMVQGIARGEKMDWILQKATELGVHAVVPVASARSEVRLSGDRADKRLAHWRSVVASACGQCGRARLPEVHPPGPLAQALEALPKSRLVLDPSAAGGLADLQRPGDDACALAIGPEGGWSPEDLLQLREAGFAGLRLGPRVLRTETAGVAAIAALQARFGDLG